MTLQAVENTEVDYHPFCDSLMNWFSSKDRVERGFSPYQRNGDFMHLAINEMIENNLACKEVMKEIFSASSDFTHSDGNRIYTRISFSLMDTALGFLKHHGLYESFLKKCYDWIDEEFPVLPEGTKKYMVTYSVRLETSWEEEILAYDETEAEEKAEEFMSENRIEEWVDINESEVEIDGISEVS